MDPFELLKGDHRKVATLFQQIESAGDAEQRRLFKAVHSELDLHARIEETVFYPALEQTSEAHELTLEAYDEHRIVKQLLGELEGDALNDEEWQAKFKVLKESVEHHVEEEEGELFDRAKEALDSDRLEALGDEMAAMKANRGGAAKSVKPRRSSPETGKKKVGNEQSGKGRGILSTLASLVGLGDSTQEESKRKTPKTKAKATTKSSAASSGGKKAGATKSSERAGTKKSTKKTSARKTAQPVAARKTGGSRSTKKTATRPSAKKRAAATKKSGTSTAKRRH